MKLPIKFLPKIALLLSFNVVADDLFRNLSANEKIQFSTNISSNCTIHFKNQTTKIPNQTIQKICSCTGREMTELLIPFDILEESQKNSVKVTDYSTTFRKIQKYAMEKCLGTYINNN